MSEVKIPNGTIDGDGYWWHGVWQPWPVSVTTELTRLRAEVETLKARNADYDGQLNQAADDLAAKTVELERVRAELAEAVRMRDVWRGKWQRCEDKFQRSCVTNGERIYTATARAEKAEGERDENFRAWMAERKLRHEQEIAAESQLREARAEIERLRAALERHGKFRIKAIALVRDTRLALIQGTYDTKQKMDSALDEWLKQVDGPTLTGGPTP